MPLHVELPYHVEHEITCSQGTMVAACLYRQNLGVTSECLDVVVGFNVFSTKLVPHP